MKPVMVRGQKFAWAMGDVRSELRPVMSPKSMFFAEREEIFSLMVKCSAALCRRLIASTVHEVLRLSGTELSGPPFRADPHYQAVAKDLVSGY